MFYILVDYLFKVGMYFMVFLIFWNLKRFMQTVLRTFPVHNGVKSFLRDHFYTSTLCFQEKCFQTLQYLPFNVSRKSRENTGASKSEWSFGENLASLCIISVIKANSRTSNIAFLMDWAQMADLDFGLIQQKNFIKKASFHYQGCPLSL